MIVPLVTRRLFDFSDSTGAAIDTVLARYLDVLPYRSGTLLVRVHSATITSTTMDVIVLRASPSPDDPEQDFVETSALATASITTGSNKLVRAALTSKFGSHLRVVLRADPTTTVKPLTATLSVAMNLSEDP